MNRRRLREVEREESIREKIRRIRLDAHRTTDPAEAKKLYAIADALAQQGLLPMPPEREGGQGELFGEIGRKSGKRP